MKTIPIHPVRASGAAGSKACPGAAVPPASAGRQRWRRAAQIAFFAAFLLAPWFDLFRLDLTRGHFLVFGHPWLLGLPVDGGEPAAARVLLLGVLPVIGLAVSFLWVAWRYGRLYCGWLCPHFAAVESVNHLMWRGNGRPSLWDRQPAPPRRPDGTSRPFRPLWSRLAPLAALGFAALWAFTLLAYLLPPQAVAGRLLNGAPTRAEALFLGIATLVLWAEFLFARHLFCRFGCAVGLLQSVAWRMNRRAAGIHFNRALAAACAECYRACEHECPMRLKPRAGVSGPSGLLSCTQCQRCVAACDAVPRQKEPRSPLSWQAGGKASGER